MMAATSKRRPPPTTASLFLDPLDLRTAKLFSDQAHKSLRITHPAVINYKERAQNTSGTTKLNLYLKGAKCLMDQQPDTNLIQSAIGLGQRFIRMFDEPNMHIDMESILNLIRFHSVFIASVDAIPNLVEEESKRTFLLEIAIPLLSDLVYIMCSLVCEYSEVNGKQNKPRSEIVMLSFMTKPLAYECLRGESMALLMKYLFVKESYFYHNVHLCARVLGALVRAKQVLPNEIAAIDQCVDLTNYLKAMEYNPLIRDQAASYDMLVDLLDILQRDRDEKDGISNFEEYAWVHIFTYIIPRCDENELLQLRQRKRKYKLSATDDPTTPSQNNGRHLIVSTDSGHTNRLNRPHHSHSHRRGSTDKSRDENSAATQRAKAILNRPYVSPGMWSCGVQGVNGGDGKYARSDSISMGPIVEEYKNIVEELNFLKMKKYLEKHPDPELIEYKIYKRLAETAVELCQANEAPNNQFFFTTLEGINDLCERNISITNYMIHNLLRGLTPPGIYASQEIANEYVTMIENMTNITAENTPVAEGEVNLLKGSGANIDTIISCLNAIKIHYEVDSDGLNAAGEAVGHTWFEFVDMIPELLTKLENKKAEEMTLKKIWFDVLGPWIQDNGSPVVKKNPVLRSVFEETRAKIQKLTNNAESIELGSMEYDEWIYGNIILQAWAKVPENFDFLIRKKLLINLVSQLKLVTKMELQQHTVQTVLELLKCDKIDIIWRMGEATFKDSYQDDQRLTNYAGALLDIKGTDVIFVELIRDAVRYTRDDPAFKSGSFDWEAIEALLIPRMQCVQALAAYVRDKDFDPVPFDNEGCRSCFVEVWDYYDTDYAGASYTSERDVEDFYKEQKRHKELAKAEAAEKKKAQRSRTLFLKKDSADMSADDEVLKSTARVTASPLDRRKSMKFKMEAENLEDIDARMKAVRQANAALQAELAGYKKREEEKDSSNKPTFLRRASVAMGMQAKAKPKRFGKGVSHAAPLKMDVKGMQRRMSMLPGAGNIKESEAKRAFMNKGVVARKQERENRFGEEEGVFVAEILEHLFGVMRVVLNSRWIEAIEDKGIVYRLVALLIDPETPPGCFPNLLFCLGVISFFKDIDYKPIIGRNGIELILDLLKRAYKHDGLFVNESVTNSLVALSALVMQCPENTLLFRRHGGIQLLVDLLRVRGGMNDKRSVNAAAALTSNICFKHIALKQVLGDNYLCESMIGALANFDFAMQEVSGKVTDISGLFKAIGNMALNDKNMKRMLGIAPFGLNDKKRQYFVHENCNNIVDVYQKFLTNADASIDENTMESSMATLSNLVIDYNYMHLFVELVPSVLQLLRREKHCSIKLHQYIFNTIANMSRQRTNAKCFGHNDGIATIMTTLPFLARDSPTLKAAVVHCLGVQTADPVNIRTLVDKPNCVYKWLNQYLEEYRQYMAKKMSSTGNEFEMERKEGGVLMLTTLPLNIMRCASRLMNSFWCAREAAKGNFFVTLAQCFPSFAGQGMLMYEACRCIMIAIDLYTAEFKLDGKTAKALPDSYFNKVFTASEKIDFNSMEDHEKDLARAYPRPLRDEDPIDKSLLLPDFLRQAEIPMWRLLREKNIKKDPKLTCDERMHEFRQPNKRPWEMIGMVRSDVKVIVKSIRECLANERFQTNIRLHRCAIGTLAYFASEKVGINSMIERKKIVVEDNEAAAAVVPQKGPGLMRRVSMAFQGPAPKAKPKAAPKPAAAPPMIQRRQSLFMNAEKQEEIAKKEWTRELEIRNTYFRIGYDKFRPNDAHNLADILEKTIETFYYDGRVIENCLTLLGNLVFASLGEFQSILLISSWKLLEMCKLKIIVDCRLDDYGKTHLPRLIGIVECYARLLKSGGAANAGKTDDDSSSRGAPLTTRRDDGAIYDGNFRLMTKEDFSTTIRSGAEDSYDFMRSGHREDPFPDGVYSLNLERERNKKLAKLHKDLLYYLRNGAFVKTINDQGETMYIRWKSSHDLMVLEWKVLDLKEYKTKKKDDDDPTYPFNVPITRILKFWNGISHSPKLIQWQKNRDVNEKHTMVIEAGAMFDFPKGLKLEFLFESTKSRDVHSYLFHKWRESASFGFRG